MSSSSEFVTLNNKIQMVDMYLEQKQEKKDKLFLQSVLYIIYVKSFNKSLNNCCGRAANNNES